MDDIETKALMEDVSVVMRALVSNALTPILAQVDTLQRELATLKAVPPPKDGKDADPAEILGMVCDQFADDFTEIRGTSDDLKAQLAKLKDAAASMGVMIAEHDQTIETAVTSDDVAIKIAEAISAMPPAEKGKDADPELVAVLVAEYVERAVAAIPVAKDGQDGAAGLDGKDGVPGKDGEPGVSGLDGKDGSDGVNGKDGTNGTDGKDGEPGRSGLDGRDGLDAVEFFRGENGHLIVTMSNGTTRDLGNYIGKDGQSVDAAEIERLIAEKVEKIAPPEIERDAYLAAFAPDDVAANVSLAVKMMAETPQTMQPHRSDAQPINVSVTMPEIKAADTTVNVSLPEQLPPNVTIEPSVVNVAPPNIHIESRRGKEVTRVTGWDEKTGRITSFEKTEEE